MNQIGSIKIIILSLVIWKITILSFAHIATFLIPFKTEFSAYKINAGLPYLVWVWANFDGVHYVEIAMRGYRGLEQGWFPLYPLLIEFLARVPAISSHIISGLIISHLFLIASIFLILRLFKLDKKEGLFPLLLIIMLAYPTSFSLGAVYNDSLFLFLATLTIYLARKKSFFLAGLVGFFAMLGRQNGIVLVILIIIEYLMLYYQDKRLDLKKAFSIKEVLKHKIYGAILIPIGLLSYLSFIQYQFGDIRLLAESMKIWSQDALVFPPQVFFRYIKIILTFDFNIVYFVAIIELLFALFYVFLIIYSYKKLRFSYFCFFAVSILIPSLTGTFAGMPRYGLHLYPMFLALSMFLSERKTPFKILYFIISIALLFLMASLFTRGYFVT